MTPTNPPAQDEAPASASDIVVTGTRITASGFNAPTPTTVIGEAQIQANAQPNIFNTVAQIAVAARVDRRGDRHVQHVERAAGAQLLLAARAGHDPHADLARRAARGRRERHRRARQQPVPAIADQARRYRHRGASASYGSDAVGRRDQLRHRYALRRREVQRADRRHQLWRRRAGAGAGGAGQELRGRSLHIVVSGEYAKDQGVGPGNFGEDLASGRDWYRATTFVDTGIRDNGKSAVPGARSRAAYKYTKYGLINNGPLQGIAFDADGRPFAFNYGSNGVPAKNANGDVIGCYVGFCVGGDQSGACRVRHLAAIRAGADQRLYRIGLRRGPRYRAVPDRNIAQVRTSNQPNPGATKDNVTVQCANPFLPASIPVAMRRRRDHQFRYGLSNAILPNIKVNNRSPAISLRRRAEGQGGDLRRRLDLRPVLRARHQRHRLQRRQHQPERTLHPGGERGARERRDRVRQCRRARQRVPADQNLRQRPPVRRRAVDIVPGRAVSAHRRQTQDAAGGQHFGDAHRPMGGAAGGRGRRRVAARGVPRQRRSVRRGRIGHQTPFRRCTPPTHRC